MRGRRGDEGDCKLEYASSAFRSWRRRAEASCNSLFNEDEPERTGRFAFYRISPLMEECGHATGEANFETEASSQSHRASDWRGRFIVRVGRRSLRIGHPDGRRSAEIRPSADTDCYAWRGRNRRRQARNVPPVRQGEQSERCAGDGVGLPLRRLSCLPWLWVAWLPMRRLRMRRLLRIMGSVPLVLSST